MKILEYPSQFIDYFKNAKDYREAMNMAQIFVNSNPNRFYLEQNGITTKLIDLNIAKYANVLSQAMNCIAE